MMPLGWVTGSTTLFIAVSFCAAEKLLAKCVHIGWPIAASIRATTVSKGSVVTILTRWT